MHAIHASSGPIRCARARIRQIPGGTTRVPRVSGATVIRRAAVSLGDCRGVIGGLGELEYGAPFDELAPFGAGPGTGERGKGGVVGGGRRVRDRPARL